MAKTAKAKAPSKSEVLNALAEKTELSRKQVAAVLDALAEEIAKNVGKKGVGVFQIPGVVKIIRKEVPAKPARKNVPNPFKPGEFRDIAAKKASTTVKVRPLKTLKDMVK